MHTLIKHKLTGTLLAASLAVATVGAAAPAFAFHGGGGGFHAGGGRPRRSLSGA